MTHKAEIKALTGIRGIAALFVMFHHWAYFLLTARIISPLSKERLSIFFTHGNWNVDLFFVLSGFLLCITSYEEFKNGYKTQSYSNFIIKRFCRVYPIYLILTFAYLIATVLFTHAKASISVILINLTLFQNILDTDNINPLAWSLSVEWTIYFLLPFMFMVSNRLNKSMRIISLYFINILILLIITKMFIGFFYLDWYSAFKNVLLSNKNYVSANIAGYYSLLRGICSYLLGIAAFTMMNTNYFKRISNLSFYLIFVTQFILLFIDSSLANIIFILLMPITLIGLTRQESLLSRTFSTKPIYFLGEISFSLYLIHYVFVMSVSPRLESVFVRENLPHYKYILFFCLLLTVIALSAASYYFLEKPINRWLRSRLIIKAPITGTLVKA